MLAPAPRLGAMPTLDELIALPVTRPTGAADPNWWPLLSVVSNAQTAAAAPQPAGGVTAWLQGNATAVMVVAGALFALALFGGRRR